MNTTSLRHPCPQLQHENEPFGYNLKDLAVAVLFFVVLGDLFTYAISFEAFRFVAKAILSLGVLQLATVWRERTPPGYLRDLVRWLRFPQQLFVTRDPESRPLWVEYR